MVLLRRWSRSLPNTYTNQSYNDYKHDDSGFTLTLDAGQIAALTEANGKDDSLVVLNAYMTPAAVQIFTRHT